MNPLLLLIAMLGTGAVSMFGSSDDDDEVSSRTLSLRGDPKPGKGSGTVVEREAPVSRPSDSEGTTSGGETSGTPTGGDTGGTTSGGDTGGTPTGGDTGGTTSGGDTGGTSTGGTTGGTSTGGTSTGGTSGGTTTPPPSPTGTPTAPQQVGGSGDGGGTQPVDTTAGTLGVTGGRVTTLNPTDSNIASIDILSGPSHGTVVANADNTLSLVLTQSSHLGGDSFSYKVTHTDGSTTTHTQDLSVSAGPQGAGWATGENHYMLATDAQGHVVVETGDNHVAVYASGSQSALSLQDIANLEGLPVSQITGNWLAQSGKYGFDANNALDVKAAELLWNTVTPRWTSSSNHLLMERGYTYDFQKPLLDWGISGEDELHPLYFGAFGTGTPPKLVDSPYNGGDGVQNVVYQGLEFVNGLTLNNQDNILVDDCIFKDIAVAIQSSGITIRDSSFYDIIRDQPVDANGDGIWDTSVAAAKTGLYTNYTTGLLLEGDFFDHIGWEDGYDPAGSITQGQPPIWFSHNAYIDNNTLDVTVRDTITMRAALDALNLRSGGFVEDVVAIDNNQGFGSHGGDFYGAGPQGHYTFFTDTLVTNAAFKVSLLSGAQSLGLIDNAEMSTLLDNLIVHSVDPNDPNATTGLTFEAVHSDSAYYDDTIVWNWATTKQGFLAPDQNVAGLDSNIMDQTTIQTFTQQLLNDPNANIADLANLLRAQAEGLVPQIVDADMILDYFQTGFGIAPNVRLAPTTVTFEPDDLADGVRWDNRINWSTDDLPGSVAGDNVDLNGADVVMGSNATIGKLDFGDGGDLNVYGGRLNVTKGLTADTRGGDLLVEGAGQIWVAGSDGSDIDIDVDGGRFVNKGLMQGADLTQTGGQVILASDNAEYDLDAGHRLEVFSSAAKIGFDGDQGGTAILDAEAGSTLSFKADANGFGTIEEFRSGAMGAATDVLSGIDLGGSTLELDLTGLGAGAGSKFTLMDADEITGLIDLALANVSGLGSRDATLVVDYISDKVTLELTSGSGAVSVKTLGSEDMMTQGEDAVWDALTQGQGIVADVMTQAEEDALLLTLGA